LLRKAGREKGGSRMLPTCSGFALGWRKKKRGKMEEGYLPVKAAGVKGELEKGERESCPPSSFY